MTGTDTTRPGAHTITRTRYAQSQHHIATYYGIAITRGMPVVYDGRPGRVTGLDGQYLLVRLTPTTPTATSTPTSRSQRPLRCHPTWKMAYPTLGIEATP